MHTISPRSRGLRLAALLCGAAVCAVGGAAHGQPSVSGIMPGGIAPGRTVELAVRGSGFDEPLAVWGSFPGAIAVVPADDSAGDPTTRRLRVTLPADAAPGIGGLIVATPAGLTDPVLLLVDDLPSVADDGKNHAPALAQAVTPPVAVDGVGDASRSDHYRFTGQPGQRIAIEVFAARLGAEFDPVVRLLDAAGREVAAADDDAALGADCRLAATLPAAGAYVIEIRDNEFRAGGRYRLRIGDFPVAFTAYPLGVQAGTTARVGVAGTDAGGVAARDVAVPADSVGGQLTFAVTGDGGTARAIATVAVGSGPEQVEAEPNDDPADANPVPTAAAVTGRYDRPRDRDCFRFDARKGERLAFRAFSRSLGSPALPRMLVQQADGTAVAESAVTEADEETLVVTIPADGSYRLLTHDLLDRGGDGTTYRIAIEPAAPFSLALKADKGARTRHVLAENGAVALDVRAKRSGYDGPITLAVDGPGGEYRVFHEVIAEKQAATRLIVLPPPGLPPGQIALLRVRGTATPGDRPFTAPVSTADLTRVHRPMLVSIPAWLDGIVPTVSAAPLAPFYAATVDRTEVELTPAAPQAEFGVVLDRTSDDFKDLLAVTFPAAPAGLSFEVKREGAGARETYRVTVKAAAGTPPGAHAVRVLCYGELRGQGLAVLAGDVVVRLGGSE